MIEDGAWSRADGVKEAVKNSLMARFGIAHELGCARHACTDVRIIGHS